MESWIKPQVRDGVSSTFSQMIIPGVNNRSLKNIMCYNKTCKQKNISERIFKNEPVYFREAIEI